MIRLALLGVALGGGLAALALGGCGQTQTAAPTATATPETALDADTSGSNIITVDVDAGVDPALGATPMAQRTATLGLLNKRNGVARDIVLQPGKAMRVGDVIVRLRACEQTAPWEQDHYTGAFVQVDIAGSDRVWRRVFSGWLFKERPALNVVQHPVYDVWVKSCAMTFPSGGPDTVAAEEGGARSSAKKSPVPAEDAPEPTAPDIAADNAAR